MGLDRSSRTEETSGGWQYINGDALGVYWLLSGILCAKNVEVEANAGMTRG